mgnify:CR=1 FL=1
MTSERIVAFNDEIWKDIKGYEKLYKVSNYGRIQSLNEFGNTKKILSPYKRNGKHSVQLYKKGISKNYYVDRIVAFNFLKNEHNYRTVYHLNGNNLDDRAINLSFREYADFLTKGAKYKQPIIMYDLHNKEINRFVSLSEAVRYLKEEYNIEANHTSLSHACKGKIKTAYKFKWRFDVKKQEETLESLKMKKILIKLLRGERLTEEERLDVTILNLLDKYFNKEYEKWNEKIIRCYYR